MRFTEIANAEDQLALWKLVSDKMWAAFAQPVPKADSIQVPQSSTLKGRVARAAVTDYSNQSKWLGMMPKCTHNGFCFQ